MDAVYLVSNLLQEIVKYQISQVYCTVSDIIYYIYLELVLKTSCDGFWETSPSSQEGIEFVLRCPNIEFQSQIQI